MSAPQQSLAVEDNSVPEWYNHCCADLNKVPAAAETRVDGMKAILTRASLMWDNGTASLSFPNVLTCGFVAPALGTSVQQAKVKEVVKEWEKFANLKFRFVPEGTVATIRISFQAGKGSWSYIGKGATFRPLTEPTMNFGWVLDAPGITPKERGVILHEFGHAIGYLHEHQSPRRGEKLQLNEAVIIEYYKRTQTPPWSELQTRQNVLNVYNRQEVTNFSAVDTTSIMMYFMPANFNVQNIAISPNYSLSPLDKAFAFLNYPFTGGLSSSDSSVNIVTALNTVGVTGSARASIAAEFAEGDWQGVRAEFTRWAVNQKALSDIAQAAAEREEAAGIAQTAETD